MFFVCIIIFLELGLCLIAFILHFYLSDVCLFDKVIFIAFYCVFYIVIPTFVFPSLNSFRGGEGALFYHVWVFFHVLLFVYECYCYTFLFAGL